MLPFETDISNLWEMWASCNACACLCTHVCVRESRVSAVESTGREMSEERLATAVNGGNSTNPGNTVWQRGPSRLMYCEVRGELCVWEKGMWTRERRVMKRGNFDQATHRRLGNSQGALGSRRSQTSLSVMYVQTVQYNSTIATMLFMFA